ncbi:IMAP FAMILY MEMBER 1 putative-RELATED [Salix purpurea]|uniref:IMAP FAMILY MEMBER 1 putative-RELATED n=1 Tax=Salix purpurea TaxID=77065 RepID=A0A9Q0WGX0_SALPP|nr:IMAP FAMILY MEMBER 1 putative-RELATED [Salix purpurea]
MAPEMFQQPLQPLDPSQTPPPSSSIDLESQLPETQAQTSLALAQEISPTPQRPSPAINAQQINGVTAKQISLEWPNMIMTFCFEAAIQIALQYEKTQQSKLPLAFYLRSLSILLTFVSLLSSHLISKKFPEISKVLEKVAIFLATFAFFTTIATPLALPLS